MIKNGWGGKRPNQTGAPKREKGYTKLFALRPQNTEEEKLLKSLSPRERTEILLNYLNSL